MATIKQINANRKNALLSKGPKSDLGPLDNNAFFLFALICLIVAMWPPLNNS